MTFDKFLKENKIEIDFKLTKTQKKLIEKYAHEYLSRYYAV